MRSSTLVFLLPLALACSSSTDGDATPAANPAATPQATPATAVQPAATARPWVPVPPVSGIHLQSLVATSGEGVERLLDGDPTTGWSPMHDPVDEGVLLRFEEPTRVMQVKLQLCPESSSATFESFVNGASNTLVRVNPGGPVLVPWRGGADTPAIKSFFLRVVGSDGPVDICEIAVIMPPEITQAVKPPRSVDATLKASSVLEPCDAYHPGYLFDGRTDFGWVEGAEGLGVGETLTIQFDGPIELTGFDLWNGYQRSADHFDRNARAAQLDLSVDGSAPMPLSVTDTQGPQRLELPTPVTGERFVLTVAQATAGSKYEDLVISELRLRDAAGPVSLHTTDLAEREHLLLETIHGSDLDRIVNRSWQGLCNESTRFTLRSNHSFVSYAQIVDDEDESMHEVFDGAWVVQDMTAPATIQTYGRKHRTQTTWVPYGDDQVQSTVRIAGGKSQLWLHDPAAPQPAATLLADPAFASEHAYCMGPIDGWLGQDMGDLLVIQGASMAGVYKPF